MYNKNHKNYKYPKMSLVLYYINIFIVIVIKI